jgi:multiple antibiotic resistance protein
VSALLFNAFVPLFVVLDPLGTAPLFVELSQSRSEVYKREAAIKGTASGDLVLLRARGTGAVGRSGDRILAFRVAGGALLFLLNLDMVFARASGMRRTTVREQEEAQEEEDISVFPLAIPLIAGPGSLTTVLLYTDNADFLTVAAVIAVLLVVLLLVLASLLLASRVMHAFGETGANAFARVLGVILATLALRFVLDGDRESFL